jgi:SAM-dependent methyltransferase
MKIAFDGLEYKRLIQTRTETIRQFVLEWKSESMVKTAVDAGCGVGFFSGVLRDCGLEVCGFDGRAENVAEAIRRFPGIPFHQANVEDQAVTELGRFDLVLCFGLLYHLENTLGAIRNLYALTNKHLFIESVCCPGEESWMFLSDEESAIDQSLNSVAFYPTEGCLVKMLYRAGFQAVYRVTRLPDHPDFYESEKYTRRRIMLVASRFLVSNDALILMETAKGNTDPWLKVGETTKIQKC